MPLHHGGYPEDHPEFSRPALLDRGDGSRVAVNGRGEAVDRIIADRARDDGPDYSDGPEFEGWAERSVDAAYPRLNSLRVPSSLTFAQLQEANRERGKHWGKGLDITYLFNAVELGGESGELTEACLHAAAIGAATGKTLNACKKYYRGEIGIAGGVMDLAPVEEELGDVVICCSLLANKLGIDLGKVVADKFNKTSEKHGFPHRLVASATYH